jgi:thiamine kinase-like enzyme
MTVTKTESSASNRVREFLDRRSGPWSHAGAGRLSIAHYRSAYLSTMFRVDGDDEPYLVILKHHDPEGRRASREFEVLSVLGGKCAPRAQLLDTSGELFSDPVLITTYVEPVFNEEWTEAHLDRLARLIAEIHTDHRLMNLAVDGQSPPAYSLARELAEETRDMPSFRDSPTKDELTRALSILESRVASWERLFDDGILVYVHGDLPHHHVFTGQSQWWTIHWEWSRQSHPTRELARALWDLEMTAEREAVLIERYGSYVPYAIRADALAVQRLLQYFYNAVHVAFWLDRTADAAHPDWEKAAAMSRVVRLWVQLEAGSLNG